MTRCDSARPRGLARLLSISSRARLSAPKVSAPKSALLRLTAALGLAVTVVHAQASSAAGHRSFPPQALRGELWVGAPPLAQLNGQPERLAPGARNRGEDNLLRLPTQLTGRAWLVHYTREPSSGMLMDVWILNRVEVANEPWPASPVEAATWRFEPASQRWGRP
jgi:hypothetical protein